jgi:hypothetical protein
MLETLLMLGVYDMVSSVNLCVGLDEDRAMTSCQQRQKILNEQIIANIYSTSAGFLVGNAINRLAQHIVSSLNFELSTAAATFTHQRV